MCESRNVKVRGKQFTESALTNLTMSFRMGILDLHVSSGGTESPKHRSPKSHDIHGLKMEVNFWAGNEST
jgi:hypothetical protein